MAGQSTLTSSIKPVISRILRRKLPQQPRTRVDVIYIDSCTRGHGDVIMRYLLQKNPHSVQDEGPLAVCKSVSVSHHLRAGVFGWVVSQVGLVEEQGAYGYIG